MAQTRWNLIVTANTWNKFFNKHPEMVPQPASGSSNAPLLVHCRIPVCIDFKEELPEQVIDALIKDIKEKGFTYTIYLCPKDDSACEKWRQKNAELLKHIPEEQITRISDWEKSEAWQKASTIYDEFSKGEFKEEFEKMLEIDKTKWAKKYPNASLEESEVHIINAVKDMLSWMAVQVGDATPENQTYVISPLMYTHDLSKSMHVALKYANKMGFIKDSFVHVKYETEVMAEEDNKVSLLTQISVKLGANNIDTKWSADFVAHLYDKLGSPAEVNSPHKELNSSVESKSDNHTLISNMSGMENEYTKQGSKNDINSGIPAEIKDKTPDMKTIHFPQTGGGHGFFQKEQAQSEVKLAKKSRNKGSGKYKNGLFSSTPEGEKNNDEKKNCPLPQEKSTAEVLKEGTQADVVNNS